MEMKKTLMAVAVALSLTTAGIAAQDAKADRKAERRAHAFRGERGFGGHMLGRAATALNLTEQQKQFAQQLMADTRKQSEPVTTELRQNRKELTEAVKANNTSAIDQLSQRQATLTAQLTALHSKAMASFYAQLTPEQKAKADEFHGRMKNRASRGQHQQR
jgi:Spy/CpxP family protein refolding chaperone